MVPPPVARAWFVPALVGSVLLKELQDTNYSLEYGGASTIGAEAVVIVKTSSQATFDDSFVTPQTWYLDSATNLPIRVQYRLPDKHHPRRFLVSTIDLGNFQPVSGVMYPFQATESTSGQQTGLITVATIQPNANITAATFDSPAGGAQ
jgi:hypothetical protein